MIRFMLRFGSAPFPAFQVGEDQFGQIVAVAAFEDAERGDVELADGFTEPMEIFGLQSFLRERIAGIGIETGGDGHEVGLKVFDAVDGLGEDSAVFGAGSGGGDGKVEAIVAGICAAGAGIAGELVNGKKSSAGVVQENGFGAVAVMDVEIEDGDPFCAGGQGFEDGDGDGVQVAKAHADIARGVMTGRAHEAEGAFAGARRGQRGQSAANRTARVVRDAGMPGRVAIEVLIFLQARDEGGAVGAENGGFSDRQGFGPSEGQFQLVAKTFKRAADAGGALGMGGTGVIDALFVGNNFHRAFAFCSTGLKSLFNCFCLLPAAH